MAVESTAYVRATSACVVVPFLYFSLFAIFVYSLRPGVFPRRNPAVLVQLAATPPGVVLNGFIVDLAK